jgi:hypothetical protein
MNSVKKAATFAGSSFSNRVEKIGKEARLPCIEGFRDFASFEALQILFNRPISYIAGRSAVLLFLTPNSARRRFDTQSL